MELLITLIFITPYIIIGVLIEIVRLLKQHKRKSLEEVLKELDGGQPH